VGLQNLGNTCFMNSSIQCLSHVPELREYFIEDLYKESVNTLAYKTNGKLAESYAALLRNMWDPGHTQVAPRNFKWQIGHFAEQFAGFGQQDSMEFIEYLLDGLKEDLNKVKGAKPFVVTSEAAGREDDVVAEEAFQNYSKRNSSRIDDLFLGFFKSTVTCPEPNCGRVSVTFDPYLSVKLSLVSPAEDRLARFQVLVVPFTGDPVWHKVSVQKSGTAGDLLEAAAEAGGVNPKKCIFTEVHTEKIYKFFEHSSPVEDIRSNDILVLYELNDVAEFHVASEDAWGSTLGAGSSTAPAAEPGPAEKCGVVIYQRQSRQSGNLYSYSRTMVQLVGIPFVTTVPKRIAGHELIAEVAAELRKRLGPSAEAGEAQWKLFRTPDRWNVNHCSAAVNPEETLSFDTRQYLVVEWPEGADVASSEALGKLLDHAGQGRGQSSTSTPIDLDRCFRLFTETDKLPASDAWYCNRCKEHREAHKTMGFWTLPPILVLQLKRFTYNEYSRDRLDIPVSFPLEGLDLGMHCSCPTARSLDQIFDLAAVSVHMGGLGGGHYIAFGRSSEDGKWYEFNDSSVREVPAATVAAEQTGAYILFYLRRDHRPVRWGEPEPAPTPEPAPAPAAAEP